MAEYDTKGSRLTCIALADGEALRTTASVGNKRKAPEDSGDDADSGVDEDGTSEDEDEDEEEDEQQIEEEEEVESDS